MLAVDAAACWSNSVRRSRFRTASILILSRCASIACGACRAPLALADALPFRAASFDVILCSWLFEHLQAPQRALQRVHARA
jgi:hypothetical protein